MLDRKSRKIISEEIRKNNRMKIGKHVYCTMDSFIFEMVIKDYQLSFNRDRWLITPVLNGTGEKWVEKITFIE